MSPDVPSNELPTSIQQLSERLRGAYRGRIASATVDAVVRSCYAPLADAKIANFVPNLVEHTSRERLRAMVLADAAPTG